MKLKSQLEIGLEWLIWFIMVGIPGIGLLMYIAIWVLGKIGWITSDSF